MYRYLWSLCYSKVMVSFPIKGNNVTLSDIDHNFIEIKRILMNSRIKIILALGLLIFLQHTSFAQSIDPYDEMEISLLTIGPGESVETLFGHSALRVSQPSKDRDIIYNYGTFDFDAPNFLMKFLRGKLPYSISTGDYGRFLRFYHAEQRTVQEQKLNLSSKQKQAVVDFLINNLKKENRYYMYDFFFDNCSTRIIDLLKYSVPSIEIDSSSKKNITYRDMLHEYLNHKPWTKLGIDLIIGAKADQFPSVRQQTFLPDYLMYWVDQAQVGNGQDLAGEAFDVIIEQPSTKGNNVFTPNTVLGLILIISMMLFFTVKKWALRWSQALLTVAGIGGVLIAVMWFLTDHGATKLNFNLVWLSPLLFWVAYGKKKWVTFVSLGLSTLVLLLSIVGSWPQAFPSLLMQILVITLIILTYLIKSEEIKIHS